MVILGTKIHHGDRARPKYTYVQIRPEETRHTHRHRKEQTLAQTDKAAYVPPHSPSPPNTAPSADPCGSRTVTHEGQKENAAGVLSEPHALGP